VIERDAAVLRCRAAVAACRDEGILLLARTDARVSRGFDEALARIQAFVAERADILFLDPPPIMWTPMLGFRARRKVSDEHNAPGISGSLQTRSG
jgi:hypothetical protein